MKMHKQDDKKWHFVNIIELLLYRAYMELIARQMEANNK